MLCLCAGLSWRPSPLLTLHEFFPALASRYNAELGRFEMAGQVDIARVYGCVRLNIPDLFDCGCYSSTEHLCVLLSFVETAISSF